MPLIFLLILCMYMFIGCNNQNNSDYQNIIHLTKELKTKEVQFGFLNVSYDEYEQIYNKLYPKNHKLEYEVLIGGVVRGKDLKNLNINEMISYVNKALDMEKIIKDNQVDNVEIKLSNVLSKSSSESYFLYWSETLEIQNKKIIYTGYYEYEKINGDYKIVDEKVNHVIYPDAEKRFSSLEEAKNSLLYQEWEGKEINYVTAFEVETK